MKYTIRRLDSFTKLFTRLQRKAARLGLPVPTFTVTGEHVETAEVYEISEGEQRLVGKEDVIVQDLEISGLEPIRLPGWQFAARVEATPAGSLVYALPELVVPARFSALGCACEHCNVKVMRKRLYLVHHTETGEWKQVGSTCLASFLGGDSAERLAEQFAFYGAILHDLDALCQGEKQGWEGGSAAFSLRTVAAQAIEMSRAKGWVSRSKAWETGQVATADHVKRLPKGSPVSEEALERADAAIAHFASATPSEVLEADTFQNNLRILCCAGYCSDKSFGLACALDVCYKVALDKQDREARLQRQRETSQHLWTPKQRVKGIVATVLKVFYYESDYGLQTKTILEDDAGNVLVAKHLSNGTFEAAETCRVRFTATVKEHGERDGVKQTILLRAKDVQFLDEAGNVIQDNE